MSPNTRTALIWFVSTMAILMFFNLMVLNWMGAHRYPPDETVDEGQVVPSTTQKVESPPEPFVSTDLLPVIDPKAPPEPVTEPQNEPKTRSDTPATGKTPLEPPRAKAQNPTKDLTS